jgi:hypothetical protein
LPEEVSLSCGNITDVYALLFNGLACRVALDESGLTKHYFFGLDKEF